MRRRSIHPLLATLIGLTLVAATTQAEPAYASVAKTHAEPAVHSFVERAGSELRLNGHPFRFAGANIFWLALESDTDYPDVQYPRAFRVNDALDTAVGMGANVIRIFGADSIGCPLCIEPSPGTFNEAAFRHLDYAIKEAGEEGLRVILSLVDLYHCYTGGIHDYVNPGTPAGGCAVPTTDEQTAFYTDPVFIDRFKAHIAAILNHVNSYTGVRYSDDPTILAWETGNELQAPPTDWTRQISAYIKSIDPHHLVMDGQCCTINSNALALDTVDMYSYHAYPMDSAIAASQATTVQNAGKVFVFGEIDWMNTRPGGDQLAHFLATLVNHPGVAGSLYWSLFGHRDTYGFTQHSDGLALHYPGDTADMRSRVQLLIDHALAMRGLHGAPHVRLTQPAITSTSKSFGENILAWRGVAMAVGYRVQRSTDGPDGPWTTIGGTDRTPATDNDTPWMDLDSPRSAAYYRVVPVDAASLAGPPSVPVRLAAYTGSTSKPASLAQAIPTAGATGVIPVCPLAWTDPGNAAYYRLTVSRSSDLSNPVVSVDGRRTTSYTPAPDLLAGATTYYWKIVAVNINGVTAASNAGESFTTRTEPAMPPTLDDFDSYCDDAALQAAWPPNAAGDLGRWAVGSWRYRGTGRQRRSSRQVTWA